jgi:putative acetyltransferase
MTENPYIFSDPDNLIGMCGVFCGGCPAYQKTCYGCRSASRGPLQKRKSKWNCKKRICMIKNQLNHCGECFKLSCVLRKPLEKRYLQNYNIDLAKNCRQIRSLGSHSWIQSQKQKFTCPHCTLPFSPYDKHCLICSPLEKN